MAPSDVAVPIAAKPATPAPIIKTFAGGTLPAAVICPVKKRPKLFPASITERYPAIFAIEDSASIFCARLILGTMSIAITLALFLAIKAI